MKDLKDLLCQYKARVESRNLDGQNPTRFYLDASFQGVKKFFVLAFDITTVNNDSNDGPNKVKRKSNTKYFLARENITNYNVLIDGRNFYDQPINNQLKKYDGIRKIATGQGDDYATGCLLDYQHFTHHYLLTVADLSKQKKLDTDPRATLQIEIYGELDTDSQTFTVGFYKSSAIK